MSEPLEEFAFENPINAVGYAQLYHVMTLDNDLSDGAYRTFAVYIKYAQQKPNCWVSIETIALDRDKSACTISRYNQELEDLGYIKRQRRTGMTTLTMIRDLGQVPRLRELATRELQGRKSNNSTCKVAIMQDVKLQKCDHEEEPFEEEPKEEFIAPAATTVTPFEPSLTLPGTEEPWAGLPPPAAEVFRSRMNRRPQRASYRRIHEAVGDAPEALAFWGEVVAKWRDLGWNPTNVDGMLECFARRELPKVKRGNGQESRQERSQRVLDEAWRKCQPRPEPNTIDAEFAVL